MYSLLETINTPDDLRKLERAQLPKLADELRAYLVESVSKTGGHLSSNLGTVELTVALHYVFNTPDDRLVWDVGHQTYAHKILTGRRKAMSGLRADHDRLLPLGSLQERRADPRGSASNPSPRSAAHAPVRAERVEALLPREAPFGLPSARRPMVPGAVPAPSP